MLVKIILNPAFDDDIGLNLHGSKTIIQRYMEKSARNATARRKGPSEKSWERMWQNGIPPGLFFDAGKCEPALEYIISSGKPPLPDGLALVPGCGRGYAVKALAESGNRFVLGLELAPTGAKEARSFLSATSRADVVTGDFFTSTFGPGRFNLIYDCTFLCAIHPMQRAAWAARMYYLLAPGGELVVDIFPIGEFTTGPPFAMSEDLVRKLLEPIGFRCRLISKPTRLARPKTARGELISRWVKT